MSRNPVPDKATVSPLSWPGYIPSVIATAIVSLAVGYWIGVGNTFLSFGTSKRHQSRQRKVTCDEASSASEISSEDDSDLLDNQNLEFSNEEHKLVIFPQYPT